ncbi:MAG: preprotein translocase subunit YajC [Elusimicrobia bacterium]|nr:preprotein translocase subunit YajC [Elusimicrobiota bacterium]
MIFAQIAPEQVNPAQISPIGAVLPLILILFVFYFLLIMPQQKKQKAHKKTLDELKEGDRIITIGGATGVISKIKDNIVTIEFKDGAKIEFIKNAISQVIKPQT